MRPHPLILVAALAAACGPETSDGNDDADTGTGTEAGEVTDDGASETSDDGATSTSETGDTGTSEDGVSSTGDDAGSDDSSNPFPPGCTDGGPGHNAEAIDADRIRISTLFFECDAPEAEFDNCSWDDYDAVFTVAGLASGTYDLSDPTSGATLVYERFWDHDQSQEGCFCLDAPSETNVAITSGTVTVETVSNPGYSHAVVFEGLPDPLGSASLLVDAACGG